MAVDFRLLVILDRLACDPMPLVEFAGFLASHGVRAMLLRERDLDHARYDKLATDMARGMGDSPTRLIVHSHVDVAQERELDLHLQESEIGTCVRARNVLCASALIGVSTHSVTMAKEAESIGASYIFFGPVFETSSKKSFGPPQGLDRLSEIRTAVSIPVFAIGGITPERVPMCIEHGANGVACIGAVLPPSHTARAIEEFDTALGGL